MRRGHARGGAARESIAMNPSPPIIEIHGDDVTVEASYLAARLGLPVDRLRAEMRRGIIYSVVERGVGEDAGRLRLTFRYRARAWTVVRTARSENDDLRSVQSRLVTSGGSLCRTRQGHRSEFNGLP
jgi:Family of unknown function (DUF6522)